MRERERETKEKLIKKYMQRDASRIVEFLSLHPAAIIPGAPIKASGFIPLVSTCLLLVSISDQIDGIRFAAMTSRPKHHPMIKQDNKTRLCSRRCEGQFRSRLNLESR